MSISALFSNNFALAIDPDKALNLIKKYDIDETTLNILKGIWRPSNPVVFKLEDQTSTHTKLTPDYVANVVMPYIQAVARLQNVIDEARGYPLKEIQINSITQGSVDVSMEGVGEVAKIIREEVSAWRKEHAKMMTQLTEQTVQAEIEAKKAEALQIRANSQKTRAEAKEAEAKAQAEAEMAFLNAKANAEKLQLENEMMRLQLHEKKIQLALDVIERLKIELTEVQKIDLAMKILDPLNEIVESPLQLISFTEAGGEDNKDEETAND